MTAQLDMAQVYTDFSGLAALRARAREDQEAALDQVARQFESLFLQMMLKSMRDASPGGGLLDSQQSEFYREMYDQQIALEMTRGEGIGLADVLKRQLAGGVTQPRQGLSPQDYLGIPIVVDLPATVDAAPASTQAQAMSAVGVSAVLDGTPDTFVAQLRPLAERAAGRLGLAPEALLAQAALETGWGRHVMRHADGSSSHNLFGIKADSRWQGERLQTSTLEYRDGVALNTRADFRAYASYARSFDDYVEFVQRNPRYREALRQAGDPAAYFDALQSAGYATDPAYADKIMQILDSGAMRRAVQHTTEDAPLT